MTDEPSPEDAELEDLPPAKPSRKNGRRAVFFCLLTYPMLFAQLFVVPAFQKMFEEVGIAIPAVTVPLLQLSNFVSSYACFLLPILIAIPAGVVVATFASADLRENERWGLALTIGLGLAELWWLFAIFGLLTPLFELWSKL